MTRAFAVPTAALLALGLTACGGGSEDSSTSTGAVSDDARSTSSEEDQSATKADDSTTSTSAMKLEVGDCIADPGASATVQEVDVIDCNAPHLYEVFHNGTLTDATYPDAVSLEEKSSALCTDAFTSYVGIPYDTSSYGVTYLNPTEGSWKQGDRTVSCLITSTDGSNLTGSAQGTNK